ncbi:chemotaxis protein CheW [Loktanella sp. F6476L]|uniref:chemotaxis protein CheW n=1 Tax=Loktanella sp. F6476L TaxID=2926405 RepID=UPI001FF3A887|nr:chemotaxis protein CheW [Loktanella sp. F6476L]MCK0121030.1 chemotaxis protein CheW [Loktanella sp. F6476L]
MLDGQVNAMERFSLEFISLIVGKQSFCIEIDRIREIRRWEPITMLPHSPNYVLGVVNLRGAVIPILDLAIKLGFDPISPTKRNVIIITSFETKMVGFLVDAVSEILTVTNEDIKEAPKMNSGTINHLVRGVITNGDDMTRIVDIDVLLAHQEVLENAI